MPASRRKTRHLLSKDAHRAQQGLAFGGREGWSLAGRAEEQGAVASARGEETQQNGHRLQVQGRVGFERGDGGGVDAGQGMQVSHILFLFFDEIARRGFGRLERLAFGLRQVVLVVEHPQVQIAFGLAGEILQHAALADHIDDGQVNRVIPMNDGLLLADVAFEVEAHEVAVNGDVLQHALEAVGDGELDVGTRAQLVEGGAFEEAHLVFQNFQILSLEVGRDVDARGTFAHLGVDEYLPLFARHRDAVMPIHHEVDLAYLVEHHGRQAHVLVEGAVDGKPAGGGVVLDGQEGAVELVVAVEAARDLLHADGLHAAIDRSADVQFFLDIVIGK